jgi:hypothetical protein
MGKVADPCEGSTNTVDYSSHLPKLHKFIVSHLKTHGYIQTKPVGQTPTQDSYSNRVSLEKGEDKITVLTPYDLNGSGDIPEEVFGAIDHSDLIIADLSGNRQAVTYELALAHALGIETILVGGSDEINFYLTHTKVINNIDFTPETISAPGLGARIDSWLKTRNKLFNSKNPLQKFYGAPLPDISAAWGLAVGFYENFARPILTGLGIVYREQNSDGEILEKTRDFKGFIVLRPNNFDSSIRSMEDALEEQLNSRFPGEVKSGKQEKILVRTVAAGDRILFFLVRDYVIDIPRTMFSLTSSPRLDRYTDESLKSEMEGVMINRFFENVKNLIKGNKDIEERGNRVKFHFGSIEEIPSIIETGQSKTWSKTLVEA